MSVASLLEEYAAGPKLLRQSVRGLTPDQLAAHPVPGTWSVLEVVCHVADFETISSDRMKLVVALQEPRLPGYDETLFAARLRYDARDLEEELAVIESVRRSTTRILRSLPPEAFARKGVHSEAGPLTLEQFLARAAGHLPHHVRFIDEKRRALGV
ncbi:MAG: DinB family protein [Planctomyces sp.]|nr:DinB family protein [Planctomyces sp.]